MTVLIMHFTDVARVQIRVYRGETKEENGETFTPWGYWIRMPTFDR